MSKNTGFTMQMANEMFARIDSEPVVKTRQYIPAKPKAKAAKQNHQARYRKLKRAKKASKTALKGSKSAS